MTATFVANTATPTTAAHWNYSMIEYVGLNNAITASSNAATINLAYKTNTVTNNSAATLTITLPTAGAIDGQMRVVRVLDFSAVAQTITWVNTEDSTATAPTTSNGSTTLPKTAGFQYNAATSKWGVQHQHNMALIPTKAYYKLDESSGNAADATGNGYTLTNNGTTTYTTGKINNGGDFGASNSTKSFSIDSATPLGLTTTDISTAFSVACWMNQTTSVATVYPLTILCKNGSSRNTFGLVMNNTSIEFLFTTVLIISIQQVQHVLMAHGFIMLLLMMEQILSVMLTALLF